MEKELVKHNEVKLLKNSAETKPKIKAYTRRWLIMLLFIYYACVNAIQWIEYSSITHIVVKYYNVSTLAVDWTSTIYMALYPVLVIPASYIIDKKGLRTAGIIGCVGTLIGTSIKVFSIRNDLFSVVLLGQSIVSASQLVIVCLPPKLAAIWFKASEVSTACSLGVFGTQVGCAIGYILPPLIVQDGDVEQIGSQLKILCWLLAGSMVPVTIVVLVYFPKEPPLPPSNAQALLRLNKQEFDTSVFFKSIRDLFLNRGFVIHMVAYSINIAVFSAVGTLLNQFILQFFEGDYENAGWMGFVMVISGTIGSILFGILLDKTHKYKEITLLIYFCSALSIGFLMFTLKYRQKLMTYFSCALVGFFINAYMPVGFELAMELTFPSEESTTSGILFAFTQISGAIMAVALGHFNLWLGAFWSLCSQAVMLFIGAIVTIFVPNCLLRQAAFKENKDLFRKEQYHGSHLVFIE
ncbi:uncharacterized MFS-type transporter C09D4.1-like isoform X2 [Diabrotica virgifera virgifera]|uniref:Uncharacterized MFS-type transporter C09D4.1-like isoform X2 n=1 Tax=Diabrotica virgifera virgifera TaxID=50390 RepID=A0A6P7GDR5_DIAVI|nr:uncharacterized MFS-type transporter C09D4.1-like isoform X2 [Diabrotica virgifera virgifera]